MNATSDKPEGKSKEKHWITLAWSPGALKAAVAAVLGGLYALWAFWGHLAEMFPNAPVWAFLAILGTMVVLSAPANSPDEPHFIVAGHYGHFRGDFTP